MLIKELKSILMVSLFAIFVFSCGQGNGSENEEDEDTTNTVDQVQNAPEEKTAVCLWSSLILRETPGQKGKYKSTIYLGEKAVFLEETSVDSSDKKNVREYIKVKLTDGSVGWVQGNMMAIGTKPYVLNEKTKLYKRPDILSAGKDEFDRMQFVVVVEEQGEWAKIKGKKRTDTWFKEGWIKTDRLIATEIDVTVAILTERALTKEDDQKKLEALMEISDNPDLSASMFISDVRSMIEEYNTVPAEPANDYIEGD